MTETNQSPAKAKEESTNSEAAVVKKPTTKTTHPSTADMVTSAIKTLDERRGSSLQAIKKYIAATYVVDTQKLGPFIRKYLKSAVTKGTIVQTKGSGANGSFKLAAEKASKPMKIAVKKFAAAKKPATKQSDEAKSPVKKAASKKVPDEKPASPKKPATKPPVKPKEAAPSKAEKATKSPTKTGSPVKSKAAASKAKKTVKSPTSKPKSPKPKKMAAPKATKKTTEN